jgi:hypothetical protein
LEAKVATLEAEIQSKDQEMGWFISKEPALPDHGWTTLPAWGPDETTPASLIRPSDPASTNNLLANLAIKTQTTMDENEGSAVIPEIFYEKVFYEWKANVRDDDMLPFPTIPLFADFDIYLGLWADREADHFLLINFNNWTVRPVYKSLCFIYPAKEIKLERFEQDLHIKSPKAEYRDVWVRNLDPRLETWWDDYVADWHHGQESSADSQLTTTG